MVHNSQINIVSFSFSLFGMGCFWAVFSMHFTAGEKHRERERELARSCSTSFQSASIISGLERPLPEVTNSSPWAIIYYVLQEKEEGGEVEVEEEEEEKEENE